MKTRDSGNVVKFVVLNVIFKILLIKKLEVNEFLEREN
jgi:hypothetical protein